MSITLKHGTSQANVSVIMNEGLKPRQGKGNWFRDTQTPSIDGFVYLTSEDFNAEFYAARTGILTNSECAILETVVEEENLYPDENFFTQKNILNAGDLKEAQKHVMSSQQYWKECLQKRALVAHYGHISKDNITNIKTFPIEESIFYAFVKHFPKKDIDTFDLGFNIHTHAVPWLRSQMFTCPERELFANLNIIPITDKEFLVRAFDKEVTLAFN
jgi:hypothetical protein